MYMCIYIRANGIYVYPKKLQHIDSLSLFSRLLSLSLKRCHDQPFIDISAAISTHNIDRAYLT